MKISVDSFKWRAKSHASISLNEPQVRRLERKNVIDRLALLPGLKTCDFQAGGGYLASGMLEVVPSLEVVCIEPSPSLADQISGFGRVVCAPLIDVPIQSEYFDRIGCLAGLHHEPDLEKTIAEMYRLLRPGGIVAIAEVRRGSAEDFWLNGFVNANNSGGHEGFFPDTGDLKRALESVGFDSVTESNESVPWYFRSEDHLLKFVREIFGLKEIANDLIIDALNELFTIKKIGSQIVLPWSLIYCKGSKN